VLSTIILTMRYSLVLSLLFCFFLTSCDNKPADSKNKNTTKLENPTQNIPFREDGKLEFKRADGSLIKTIDLEIADTDSLRERGLMQRSSIGDNQGMLFIFDQANIQNFWMANTPLSLDFFFFNDDGSIVNIVKYVRPMSTENTSSTGPAKYVLEVGAGFIDRNGITEADLITWTRN